MRPVTRGAQGAYPYVVDVSNQGTLDTSLKAIKVTFGGKAITPIKKVWGVSNPTASQVLNGLLMIAKDKATGAPPPAKKVKVTGPTLAQVTGVKKTVDKKLGTFYALAAGPLEAQLGRFCSFCEMYNQTGVAVEHIVPKARYPLFFIAWNNFLLACPVCNSNKLSKPPRDDAQFSPVPTDEVGYYTTILDNYLWPHKFTKVYRTTKPQLEYYEKTWKKVTYPVADGTELKSQDSQTRTIKADVYIDVKSGAKTKQEWRIDVPVRVRVMPDNDLGTNMVNKLANLNKPSSNDKRPGGEADIRMWTRTLQWFKALRLLQLLKGSTAGSFDRDWQIMMESVQSPGVYSVWVTVLDLLGPGGSWTVPGDPATTVMTKFLTQILDPQYFPGTDTDDTP